MGVVSPAAELLDHRLGDAADVGVGGARGDDEEVGRVAQPAAGRVPPARRAFRSSAAWTASATREAGLAAPARHSREPRLTRQPRSAGAVLDLVEHRPGAGADVGAEHAGGQRDETVPRAGRPPRARSAPAPPRPGASAWAIPKRTAVGRGVRRRSSSGSTRGTTCSRPRTRSTGTTRPSASSVRIGFTSSMPASHALPRETRPERIRLS